MLLELLAGPHVAPRQRTVRLARFLRRVILLDRVVRQVDRLVVVVQVELARAEAQVAVAEHPHPQVVAGEGDQEVLPDVELGAVDEQGFFWNEGLEIMP